MSPQVPAPDFDDDGDVCTWCGGDGYTECDDPIQCLSPNHVSDDWCECAACNGRGYGQVIW